MNSKRFKVVSPRLLYVLDLFKYTSHTVVGGVGGLERLQVLITAFMRRVISSSLMSSGVRIVTGGSNSNI